jgi:hypothetical protein
MGYSRTALVQVEKPDMKPDKVGTLESNLAVTHNRCIVLLHENGMPVEVKRFLG